MSNRAIIPYHNPPHWYVRFDMMISDPLHTELVRWAATQDMDIHIGWSNVRVPSYDDAVLLCLSFR